jgi:hypothetical protein
MRLQPLWLDILATAIWHASPDPPAVGPQHAGGRRARSALARPETRQQARGGGLRCQLAFRVVQRGGEKHDPLAAPHCPAFDPSLAQLFSQKLMLICRLKAVGL